jgi:hypothetical protein
VAERTDGSIRLVFFGSDQSPPFPTPLRRGLINIGPGNLFQGQLFSSAHRRGDKSEARVQVMIDGFSFKQLDADAFLFCRVADPQHEYIIKIAPVHIEMLEIVPATLGQGDPEVDATRFREEALKAAKKCQYLLFPKAQPV